MSYTTFTHSDLEVAPTVECNSFIEATVTVCNNGNRAGDDVVQIYGHDLVGTVTRPVAQLLGYARITLAAGQTRRVTFTIPTTRLAFTGLAGNRIVEPGMVDLWVGASDRRDATASIELVNGPHAITVVSPRITEVSFT
jgi:beta-glucosidase